MSSRASHLLQVVVTLVACPEGGHARRDAIGINLFDDGGHFFGLDETAFVHQGVEAVHQLRLTFDTPHQLGVEELLVANGGQLFVAEAIELVFQRRLTGRFAKGDRKLVFERCALGSVELRSATDVFQRDL